jgi:Spy/CpxP family protein refolding chaperone
MFGFVIGAASLAGLIYVLTHGRPGWRGLGGPGRWMVERLIAELDANAEQARTIRDAAEELVKRARAHREQLARSRAELAAAVRGPALDEVRLGELFAQHDELLSAMRRDVTELLGRVHLVLDDRQRRILGDRIEKGFGWRRRRWHTGGPYRSRACCGEGV